MVDTKEAHHSKSKPEIGTKMYFIKNWVNENVAPIRPTVFIFCILLTIYTKYKKVLYALSIKNIDILKIVLELSMVIV